MSTYMEKLKDPRWQKKRLKVMERDEWECRSCESTEKTLHVHHTYYEDGKDPWDYPASSLVTLCESCHEEETGARRRAEEDALLSALRVRGYLSHEINSLMYDIYNLTRPKHLGCICQFFERRLDIEKTYAPD